MERIVQAAAELLRAEPEAGLEEVAAAAGVSRSTIYRHLASREELVRAVGVRAREAADANQADALRPPGELAGGPTPLDVADVLDKVPPHLLGEQIVAEAQRLVGVTSVALYLVDIDGTLCCGSRAQRSSRRRSTRPWRWVRRSPERDCRACVQ